MVRRTKADAEATRQSLLDAAEHLFQSRGVSRTSLNDIATAAGTTRGAIYWHFKDKVALFNAMMDRVTHPLEQVGSKSASMATLPPLERLRSMVDFVQRTIVQDERTRRVFEIALYKVEYVSELMGLRERHVAASEGFTQQLARDFALAAESQGVVLSMSAMEAAISLHALFDGLIRNWILNEGGFDLVRVGGASTDAFLQGVGLSLDGFKESMRPCRD